MCNLIVKFFKHSSLIYHLKYQPSRSLILLRYILENISDILKIQVMVLKKTPNWAKVHLGSMPWVQTYKNFKPINDEKRLKELHMNCAILNQ